MIIAQHSEKTKLSARTIWEKWTDVASWKQWDDDIEYSDLDGPFDVESTGVLKISGGPVTTFMLKEVDPMRKFVEASILPIGELKFHHHIEKIGRTTRITHKVELLGPFAIFFGFLLRPKFNIAVRRAVKKLVTVAENENKLHHSLSYDKF